MNAESPGCIRQKCCRRSPGFSLLEVLVALVLLAGVGAALLGSMTQTLHEGRRLQQSAQLQQWKLDAKGYLDGLDLASQPMGSHPLHPGVEVIWSAEPLEAPRTETRYSAEWVPRWRLTLFRVRLILKASEGSLEWVTTQAAWESLPGWKPPQVEKP